MASRLFAEVRTIPLAMGPVVCQCQRQAKQHDTLAITSADSPELMDSVVR